MTLSPAPADAPPLGCAAWTDGAYQAEKHGPRRLVAKFCERWTR